MSVLLWLLPVVPAGVGSLLVGVGVVRRPSVLGRAAAPTAVSTSALVLVVAILLSAARPHSSVRFLDGLPAGLGVDGLSAVMTVTVAAVTVLVLVYAAFELGADSGQARARFFGLMLLFSAAMQLTVTSTTLPLLLVGWEVITSYALIGFWWQERRRVESATVAFITTRAADLGLYVAGAAALAGMTSGPTAGRLTGLADATSGWRHVIAAGIVLAAAGKSAQLPFSYWLSRAMDGPSPVSALLHSATMVAAGGYLLLRTAPLLHATGWAGPAVAWLGAATAVGLGVVALVQTDLKQLLAASTCAQIGFIFIAAGTQGVGGGTVQLVAHAATKALLFLCAGAWLSALGTRQLQALRGAARLWPRLGAAFAVGALSLAGLPPLALWASKEAALSGAEHNLPLYAAGLLAAALSAAYSARAVTLLFSPLPVDPGDGYDSEERGTRHLGLGMTAPALVLAVFSAGLVVLGVGPLARRINEAISPGGRSFVSPVGLATSGVVALVVSGVVAWLTLRPARQPTRRTAPVRAAQRWWALEDAAMLLVARPVLRTAKAAAWVDDNVVDRAVEGLAILVRRAAGLATSMAEVGLDDVVGGVGAAGRRLGRLARRPQTGQLHQYYAQAAVALGAAVLLLLVVR